MAKVDLEEIKNIPEDEFKTNLFQWVEQMDISKELQSKLRSDLFQNFGKTALGIRTILIVIALSRPPFMIFDPIQVVKLLPNINNPSEWFCRHWF